MSLCVYGEVGVDILVNYNSQITSRWGGAGLYASLAIAAQGKAVEILTILGPEVDTYSLASWKYLGVSYELAEVIDKYVTPRYLVTGFNNFEKKVSRPMSNIKVGYNYIPQIPEGCKGLILFPIDHTIPEELCKEAKNRNIPIFLDPKPHELALSDARNNLKYADILLVNEDEAVLLSEEIDLQKAIEKLRISGPKHIVIKRGVKGCIVASGIEEKLINIPSYKSNVVCTLGSGDVFGGALAVAFLETGDIEFSVRLASCVAANFIEHIETEAIIGYLAARKDMENRRVNEFHLDTFKSIYLAGPFFCEQELIWINHVCKTLENIGFKVHSPSRENGIITNNMTIDERRRIFELDITLLEDADLIIALLDHDDPGTHFEIGYAYSRSKPIIGFKTSSKALNNMILFGCNSICTSIEQLITEVCNYAK